MQLNRGVPEIHTYEGGKAKHITDEQALRRSLMCCMLWEDQFYEEGAEISKRIAALVGKVKPRFAYDLAIEARNKMKLRHAPLWVANAMLKIPGHKSLVSKLLQEIIQRPDELCEMLAIYWKDGKRPLAKQLQKGLAKAFPKFNAYQLAKYNRDNAIKLKDVLFLSHAKPIDEAQGDMWKKLIAGTLEAPDTWEVELSAGKGEGKKKSWERLIREEKLGALAILRNLRNMITEGIPDDLIRQGLANVKADKVLPFRFITAARYAPRFEPELEEAMFKCLEGREKLSGKTILLVDVSGSMDDKISAKSELTRLDAACGLAMLLREIGNGQIFTFSNNLVEIPNRRGFGLRDAVVNSQPHSGTQMGGAVQLINHKLNYDRLIVITDEQSASGVPDPKSNNSWVINIASARNGVGYGKWKHLDGWSEACVDYIQEFERANER